MFNRLLTIKEIRNKETQDYRVDLGKFAFNRRLISTFLFHGNALPRPAIMLAFNLKYASTFPNDVTPYCS